MFSCAQLFGTPWTVTHQAPLSMEILQARILERVAMPSSRECSPTQGSNPGLPHCRQILYQLSQEGSQQGQLTNTKDNSSSLGKLTSVSVPYTPRVLTHILKTAQKASWTVKTSVQLHVPGCGVAADQEPGCVCPHSTDPDTQAVTLLNHLH